jgi:two-component system response regulator FlrC
LENVIERATLLSGGAAIDVGHLTDDGVPIAKELPADASACVAPPASPYGSLWEMERDLIFKTLARVKDNRTHAAKELGISIRTLRNKLREYRDMGYQIGSEPG